MAEAIFIVQDNIGSDVSTVKVRLKVDRVEITQWTDIDMLHNEIARGMSSTVVFTTAQAREIARYLRLMLGEPAADVFMSE